MKRENIKEMLKEKDFFPRKSLGQNFLVDENIARRIAEEGEVSKKDTVIEVGPGVGALTRRLAEKAGKVIAVEKDERLIPFLEKNLEEFSNVEVVREDILTYRVKERKYKVIANIPYYITSPIIRKFLEEEHPPSLLVLTLQKEIAERIKAKPPKMSLLAVSVQVYAKAEVLFNLPPGKFYPSPDVTSSVVRIKPAPEEEMKDKRYRKKFFRVVKAGFAYPRKQLKNNLLLLDTGSKKEIESKKEVVEKGLKEAGIDPQRRAETLTVEEWKKLTKKVTRE